MAGRTGDETQVYTPAYVGGIDAPESPRNPSDARGHAAGNEQHWDVPNTCEGRMQLNVHLVEPGVVALRAGAEHREGDATGGNDDSGGEAPRIPAPKRERTAPALWPGIELGAREEYSAAADALAFSCGPDCGAQGSHGSTKAAHSGLVG